MPNSDKSAAIKTDETGGTVAATWTMRFTVAQGDVDLIDGPGAADSLCGQALLGDRLEHSLMRDSRTVRRFRGADGQR